MFKNKKTTDRPRIAPRRPSSGPVYSYYSSRSPAGTNVGRLQNEAKKAFAWKFIPSLLAAAAMLISVLYSSTLDMRPRIQTGNTDTAGVLQPDSVYQAAAGEELKKSIFNRSKLMIDTEAIEERLLKRFPELETAAITVPLTSRRPIINVQPVRPLLLLTSGNRTYVLDARGRAVLEAAKANDELALPGIRDEGGLEVKLGQGVVRARDAAFIAEVHHQLTEAVEVEAMILPPAANELHIRLKNEAFLVKFNMQGDARLQAGAYLAVREKLAADKIKPLEYVDVRVEEKAFYK